LQLHRFTLGSAALAFFLFAGGTAFAQQQLDCQSGFGALRMEYEKRGKAVEAANKRKASVQEACGLFKSLVEAQGKMLKYLKDNQIPCNVPGDVLKNLGASLTKTTNVKTQVCTMAANGGGARPVGSGLSSAINITGEVGGPPPERTNGGGLFDTMNGNILQK
jgi:hypothetical protein